MDKISAILSSVKSTLWILVLGVFYGLIGGLGGGMGILFMKGKPFWALGISAFFALFHWHDLKRFWEQRRITAFVFRFLIIFGISSFIGGFVWFSVGGTLYPGDGYILIGAILFSMIGVVFRMILWEFFPESGINKGLTQTIDGMRVSGALW